MFKDTKISKKANEKVSKVTKATESNSKSSTGKRKYHTKSRKGCDTCKRRRVKCDEGKPICGKCDHMGIKCSYSAVASGKNNSSKADKVLDTTNQNENVGDQNTLLQLLLTNATNGMAGLGSSLNALGELNLSNFTDSSGILSQLQSSLLLNIFNKPQIESNPLMNLFSTASDLVGAFDPGSTLLGLVTSNELYPGLNDLASQAEHQQRQKDDDLGKDKSIQQNPVSSQGEDFYGGLSETSSPDTAFSSANLSSFTPNTSTDLDSVPESISGMSRRNSIISNTSEYHGLNSLDLKLMFHYTTKVWRTITAAGISEEVLWSEYIPKLAFDHPFLMHSLLAFSATHLSRSESGLDECVTKHRGEALRLLRDAVSEISLENTDALVASAIILIMDALANASLPSSNSPKSLPASAWIYHVKGAATILAAVWPLNKSSKFHKFISVDLSDLGDIINNPEKLALKGTIYSELECFDDSIMDLYPVDFSSPYLITLAYLDKLHNERYKSDFILRVFAFPALLDKTFLALLMTGDLAAMRIMRVYYSMLREFTNEMRNKVWFLEGVCQVLPADVDQYSGGGGMHMMLDFLGDGLPSLAVNLENDFGNESRF